MAPLACQIDRFANCGHDRCMTQVFASRITRIPMAYDLAAQAEIAAAFSDLGPQMAGLLAATAGCSPYLNDLIKREQGWLRASMAVSPETVLAHGHICVAAQANFIQAIRCMHHQHVPTSEFFQDLCELRD